MREQGSEVGLNTNVVDPLDEFIASRAELVGFQALLNKSVHEFHY
jgi:hypothetical protein